MTKLISTLVFASLLACGLTAAQANSTNPPSPPFKTTSTQGGSTNDCNNNPGCTDTKTNPAGNNATCTGPDSKCSK